MNKTNSYLVDLDKIRSKIEAEILNLPPVDKIPLFYEPIYYINRLGGKKIRPQLTVLSGMVVGGLEKNLLPPAAAIELLHNFSLVHDDIMDNDDTRRGNPTVHVKWDLGTAILAGDGLLGLAYRKLLQTPAIENTQLVSLFTEAVLEICEGQALDKTFESSPIVSEEDYLKMISKKTATLIKLACQIGAIVGGGTIEQIEGLAQYGFNMGMGFQVQDDLLDILADERKLGKKVGSDFAMNKKTIIRVKLAQAIQPKQLTLSSIEQYRHILIENRIVDQVKEMIEYYFTESRKYLAVVPQNKYKRLLNYITDYIQRRDK